MCTSRNSFVHKQLVKLIRYWIGCFLFLFGFYYIEFSDSRALKHYNDTNNNKQTPIRVIIANHQTIFDGAIILWKTNGVIAAKKEISKAPLFARILTALRTLWIDRSGTKGRNYAKQQIIDHVNDLNAPPLIIFPQGTCSNVRTVTCFKTGAYLPKQKVLEVALNWSRNKSCDLSFVADVPVIARILHVGCCQFINYCHVDICNEHTPTFEEQQNIALFAENSRKIIVKSLNTYNMNKQAPIVTTKHSYSDWKLLEKATKANIQSSHLLMDDIISNLRLRTKTVTYLADRFGSLDLNGNGFIEYDEFCEAFGRDPSEDSKQFRDLFNVFNTEDIAANRIGFDEFLVGVATCFMDEKIKDAVKIMFNANENEMNSNETEKCVLKENVLYTYQKYVNKNKFDDDEHGYSECIKRMKRFVDHVFGENDKLNFEAFYQCIQDNNYQNMVQHYLQSIILIGLKIKLKKNDFVTEDEGIYINPLTELVRSTSIQSISYK